MRGAVGAGPGAVAPGPGPGARPDLWTIGHATRALAEVLTLLGEHGIRRLVDVRTIPRSRHNPQFNRDTFPMETAEFEQSLASLIRLARERPTAIMCAEAVPWRCHRSLIADALTARGLRVAHVLGPGHAAEHLLTPWARVEGPRISYPAGETI